MTLFFMAKQHMMRQKKKAILLLIGMIIGIGTLSTVYGLVANMKEELIIKSSQLGPNIIIYPENQGLTFAYGGVRLPEIVYNQATLTTNHVQSIIDIQEETIQVLNPKLLGLATMENQTSIEVVGTDFLLEQSLYPWLGLEESLIVSQNENNLIVGAKLVSQYGLILGETLSLNGTDFVVGGILLETGSEVDRQVIMSLEDAQIILGLSDQISRIEMSVLVDSGKETFLIDRLGDTLDNVSIKSMSREMLRQDTMYQRVLKFGSFFTVLVILTTILLMGITMAGSVRSRTIELAILRSIGYKNNHIIKLIVAETLWVSLFGGILGIVLGLTSTRYFDINLIIGALLLSGLIGSGVSLYPTITILKQSPIESLRFIE